MKLIIDVPEIDDADLKRIQSSLSKSIHWNSLSSRSAEIRSVQKFEESSSHPLWDDEPRYPSRYEDRPPVIPPMGRRSPADRASWYMYQKHGGPLPEPPPDRW